MRFPQTGGCQCGAIRYEVKEAPHLVYTCHCTECQRLTGSAFSMALVVAGAAFQLAGTQPRPLQRKADSGPARWTTLLGRARQRISGPAARSLGSYCRKRIRGFETQPEDLAWMRAGSA